MNTNNIEIWKPIPNYEGLYEVSNHGNVRSLKNGVYKNLNIYSNGKGYYRVALSKNGSKVFTVHVLVAMAFLNHKPNKHTLVVDHIDGNTVNNHLDNLQVITHRQNISKQKPKTSKYVGVSWVANRSKWRAQITINSKTHFIGKFDREIDAHNAYQEKLELVLTNQIVNNTKTQSPNHVRN